MNNTHLHIIGSEFFYNLLNELRLNYSISYGDNLKYNNQGFLVRIIFPEKLPVLEIKKYLSENIATIFLLKNKDYFKKNNLNLLEFHLSLFVPLEIISFKEIKNICGSRWNNSRH